MTTAELTRALILKIHDRLAADDVDIMHDNFENETIAAYPDIDPGIVRACLAVARMRTADTVVDARRRREFWRRVRGPW